MKIAGFFNIKPGVTALIGGGGKTTLMETLSDELSEIGTVIITTSTKILIPRHIPVLTDGSVDHITTALQKDRVICVGTIAENGKLSAPAVSFETLKQLSDYVIVEADGAHGLPIKAHADYEPVIPENTDKTILVIGADCFNQPIDVICHRPERFAEIAGVDIHTPVTPEIVHRVITAEGFGDILYINIVEDQEAAAAARSLAKLMKMPVLAGSLQREEILCLR